MIQQSDQLLKALTNSFDEFITAFSSFENEEINHKPSPNGWTPAQVALHIIKATDGVPDSTTKPPDRDVDFYLPRIRPWWNDLNQKFTSPEQLRPDDRSYLRKELLSELNRVRDKDIEIVLHQDLRLICLDLELPGIGYLTRYEWLWFIQMHLNRHRYQLQNMKK